jgi:serine/threonine protein phosphatase PrpC
LNNKIGDLGFKDDPNLKYFEQAVTACPEIGRMKITPDMQFVLMACDGVWDCVDFQKLCEYISVKLKLHPTKKRSEILSELFGQIIAKTNNSKGVYLTIAPIGTDNMSCILVEFIHDSSEI